MANLDLEAHAAVQERVGHFYQDFPDGSIRTFLVRSDGPEVIFEARVYRSPESAAMGVYTSGWARGFAAVQTELQSNHVEDCESSAVSRALANMGYTTPVRHTRRSTAAQSDAAHEPLLEYIKSISPRVSDDAEFLINGKIRNLKGYVRENWSAIKDRPRIAQLVVNALESATGAQFEREAA
jgi:hypothetical protein